MATTYYCDNAASDLNKNTVTAPANSKKLLQTAAGSSTLVTITLPSSGSLLQHWFITDSGDPGSVASSSGDYTLKIKCTTANANLSGGATFGFQLARVNSSGVVQASSNAGAASTWPQAVATTTWFTGTTRDLGTFGATDRLALCVQLTNGAMSVQSVIIEVGLAGGNEEVTAPWTLAAAADIPEIIMAPPR